MSMPEAAMDKDHRPQTGKNNVWFAWQIAAMKAKPEALAVQKAANQNFWFCISAAYPCHHPASRRAIDNIYHRSKSSFHRMSLAAANA